MPKLLFLIIRTYLLVLSPVWISFPPLAREPTAWSHFEVGHIFQREGANEGKPLSQNYILRPKWKPEL